MSDDDKPIFVPERCTACNKPINPQTGECAGCSD